MQNHAQLFNTVEKNDYLGFIENKDLNYKKVAEFFGFDRKDLSRMTSLSVGSVRFDSKIPAPLAQRLEEIANVANRITKVFDGDAKKSALWFRTSNPMLGEISPRDMLRMGRHKRLVKFINESIREPRLAG